MSVAKRSPTRALLYARVSAAGSDGRSVESQLEEGRMVAHREGWTIVGEHRDDGISASRYAKNKLRPGWQAAMDDIAEGKIDLLIVWEISRATRDRKVWSALIAAVSEADVMICVGGKLHDPNDPDDSFMLDLTAALAVRESGVISRRVRSNLNRRADAGLPHGRVPYGYRRVYEEHSGRPLSQEIDPETGPIVREIVARVLQGDALYSIARDLNKRGVQSPLTVTFLRNRRPVVEPPWRPDQVGRVAKAPTNAGLRVLRGQVMPGVDAKWEPLVSRADYARVLEIFADPRRHTTTSKGERRNATSGDSVNRHLLVGLARCGECGAVVRRMKNRTVPSYVCSRGFHVSRAMHFVDHYVTEVVLGRLARPDVADLFIPDDEDDAERVAAGRELADLRATLDGWYEAGAAGTITPAGLAKIEARLLGRIEDAERRSRPKPSSPVLVDLMNQTRQHHPAEPMIEVVRAWWDTQSVPARREVIRLLVDVKIHRTRRGARRLDPDSIELDWQPARG